MPDPEETAEPKGAPTQKAPLLHRVRSTLSARLGAVLPPQPESRRVQDAAAYWSDSAESDRIRALSHWAGKGDWEDTERWESIGQSHLAMWEHFTGGDPGGRAYNTRMIEWGSGGGANVAAFAKVFDTIYGVDISPANLEECAKQVEARGTGNFTPVLIDAADPESAVGAVDQPCDFFLSTAVFQHFPSQDYGARVLDCAAKMLRPGAFAIIHIRYDDLQPAYRSKRRDYRANAITFTSYKLHAFWQLTIDKGFVPQYLTLRPHANNAYYFLRRL